MCSFRLSSRKHCLRAVVVATLPLVLAAAPLPPVAASDGDPVGAQVEISHRAVDTWHAERLARSSKGYVEPRLAVAPNGAAVVVWNTGTDNELWARRFVPDQGWTKRVLIGHGISPRVDMNERGDIAIVWTARVSAFVDAVRVAHRPAAGPWRRPVTLHRGSVWRAPEVSVGPQGKITVAAPLSAPDVSPGRTTVFTRIQRWSKPRVLSELGTQSWETRVVTGPGGGVTVAWTHDQGNLRSRVCTSVTTDSRWNRPSCWRARGLGVEMSVDNAGRVYVLDAAQLHSGGPGRPWREERTPRVQGGCVGLALDAAGDGRASALWMVGCQEVGPIAVTVARRFPGGDWSRLRTIDDNASGDVAVTTTGVVYALVNQLDDGLSVTRKRPGTRWSDPVVLDEKPASSFNIEGAGSEVRTVWFQPGADGFGGPGNVWTARRVPR